MSFNRSCYPDSTEGPFGLPMTDAVAKAVERILESIAEPEERRLQRAVVMPHYSNELRAGERADISILSTAAVDRDREVVLPKGIDLSQFRKNPVVTFAHRYDLLPVGSARAPGWIRYDAALDALKAKTMYEPRPAGWSGDWLPDAVFAMVQSGTLVGKSIGFVPLEATAPSAAEIAARPELAGVRRILRRCLLLEYAVAPVQANPDALVEAVSKGKISPQALRELGVPEPVPALRTSVLTEAEYRRAVTRQFQNVDVRALVANALARLRGAVE